MLAFLSEWAALIVLCWQPIFAVVIWSLKKTFASREDLSDFGQRLGALEARFNAQEVRFDTLPTAQAVNEILVLIERVRGDIGVVQERTEGQSQLLKRVDIDVRQIKAHYMDRG